MKHAKDLDVETALAAIEAPSFPWQGEAEKIHIGCDTRGARPPIDRCPARRQAGRVKYAEGTIQQAGAEIRTALAMSGPDFAKAV
jgi:hypothetical protein